MWWRDKRGGLALNLALQGGGAHGAFTWGVLERLLEEEDLAFGWISGTSAGAVNAVALAAGLARGGREGARAALAAVWEGVARAGLDELARVNPFLYGLARAAKLSRATSLFSPYELNPLRFDPLRELLATSIDFKALQEVPGPELLIAATEVASGRPRLFRRHETTLEVVLASACLPMLHHAVQIDGRAYWDGGFSANPDITTLALESSVADTLIVQLNPRRKSTLATTPAAILAEVDRLTFQQPLVREAELVVAARQATGRDWRGRPKGPYARLCEHRFHLIEAGRHVEGLAPTSKAEPDRSLIGTLRGAGRSEAQQWLAEHRDDVGRRETLDLALQFLDREPGPAPADVRRAAAE
jgi:NTE family protein